MFGAQDSDKRVCFEHPPFNLPDRQVVVDLLRLVKELEQDRATRAVRTIGFGRSG
ncbi:MAG: hypothetical protein ACRERX_09535 [Pseudomonas sp.]